MRKYENFILDWNINNQADFNNALDIFEDWANNGKIDGKDMKVKDVVKSTDPSLYDKLSSGDKCRVGRAVSTKYSAGYYSGIHRGNNKGVTKTYQKI